MTALAVPDRRAPGRPGTPAGHREAVAVRAALAMIALAIADDAFLHPEPGTAAADHLVSGLVPLAVAAVVAFAYPRMRPGLRAITCLVCGSLAAVAGVADGVRHITVDRMGGDDLTAVLGGLAGLALIAIGVTVLWRSRRRDERRARRWARRGGIAIAAVLAAYLLVLPVAIAIVATHRARSPVAAADLGRPYERVALRTRDGHRLAAWYVPSRNGAAVIAFPGRVQPVPQARMLVRHGYGVLLLDRRGEGRSGGDANAFGWGGAADVVAAVRYLQGRPDVVADRVGGLGLSVGGELMLEAAAREPALKAVVAEGPGVRTLAEHLHTPGLGGLQRWLSNWVVQTGALAVLSDTSPPTDLRDLAARIPPRPVLLIQAAHGAGGEELVPVYREASGGTLWRAQGGHTGAMAAQPGEYERRVVGFFDREL